MKIRKSTMQDLPVMMELFAQARAFMKANGNPNQWGDSHPAQQIIENDILAQNSYVCIEDEEILGTFFFQQADDPTYAKIYNGAWLDDAPYAVIHRITAPSSKCGVASFCLDWAFGQYPNLRIDTHKDNIPMQNLLHKKGFRRCGIIHLANGEERIAFQKNTK